MKWDDLTMSQKSELMRLYIRNGITSLDQMSSHFNTYANGGPKKTFQEWSQAMKGKYPWLELNSQKAGYDYERYFNENYEDAVARLNEAEARHFTDKYKLPNHPTFSDESIYSRGPSYGGTWTKDDKFVPSVINTQQYPKVYDQNRTYTEEEIYDRLKHRFDEGGPKQNKYITPRFPEEYQVLPVNEEGLPYYTLPDIEVVAERLPQAKATDANIQRYANAVASGQLKLTQIPNTELRNRVRAKPIVDQITRDRDKTLAPILMGTVGMPAAIIGGISAAPTVAAIVNNPIVDAGLTIHGAATAPRNIKEGVQEIKGREYGKGALDLGLTALDIYGATNLAARTARILNPKYRGKIIFNNLDPVGYHASPSIKKTIKDNYDDRIKPILRQLWEEPKVDAAHPEWYDRIPYISKDNDTYYGRLGAGSYLAPDVKNRGIITDRARIDAEAIYFGLEPKYNIYVKNADGTYSYNMNEIMKLSEGTWHPILKHKPKEYNIITTNEVDKINDFVTGAAGGLQDYRLIDNNLLHIEDTWDLHPFKDFSRMPKWLREMEMGKILGGKPFTMKTDIPIEQYINK